MNYHFKLHKENIGYWAECCELDGCITEGDTLNETYNACKEALDVYLYEGDDSERIFPLPDETLENKKNTIKIMVEPQKALAILLKNHRLNKKMTQKQFAEMLGMKNIYSYQRLEKESNATLNIINKIHKVFPEIKLEYLFQ
ncbi:MAG: type II toxin-antitoxin system HicB family antitoxin [Spirochaetia bacterium]|jgi:predicted RNase H-like HicB family nuclease/DNA-binding XRE family transcriptional regulator|nr:type II toxin-antitoxin system HicB family antitoxin [Spirochaetia bacterium]